MFTGEIDLNKLQENVGIGIDQITKFANNEGVEAISDYVTFKVVSYGIAIGLTMMVACGIIYRLRCAIRGYSKNGDYPEDPEIVSVIFAGVMTLTILLVLISMITTFLGRLIAPEITFIQHFME